jgi:hypothetical protein
MMWQRILTAALFCVLAACNREAEQAASAPAAEPGRAADSAAGAAQLQAMLAYEHDVEIRLPAEQIPPRLKLVQSACASGKFGACVVLGVRQQGGDSPIASLKMRVVPAGVEPLIAAAGNEDEIGSRNTRAEDLAVAVTDNTLLQDRLRRQHARLSEFQQRDTLAIADMITLSQQLAETEAQLEAAAREGAQYKRRIETQLLTITFVPPGGESGRGEIGQAFRDFVVITSATTAWLIRAIAVLLPVALIAIVIMLVIGRLRRRKGSP